MEKKITKRELGEVWKEDVKWDKQGQWKVQFPKGIQTYKTKKRALQVAEMLTTPSVPVYENGKFIKG